MDHYLHEGSGRISLSSDGRTVVFTEMSATYPLKLLSPRIPHPGVALVYILSYGGGLVSGDVVQLAVNVDERSILVALSQGSTKVFKARPGQRRSSLRPANIAHAGVQPTTQSMNVNVMDDGAFFLLPDPVTCYRSASYHQMQIFHLSARASLIVLDWFTSGRKNMGEDWSFSRYLSTNEVWVDGQRIAKDNMLLENQIPDAHSLLGSRNLASRLSPYSCYATLLLHGPLLEHIVQELSNQFTRLTVFKCAAPNDLIWSLSPISANGAIVRVGGKDVESVKNWLKSSLARLEDVIGTDAFRRTFV